VTNEDTLRGGTLTAAYNRPMLPAARPEEPAISRALFWEPLLPCGCSNSTCRGPSRSSATDSDLAELPERIRPAVMHDLWEAVHEVTGRAVSPPHRRERPMVASLRGPANVEELVHGDALAMRRPRPRRP